MSCVVEKIPATQAAEEVLNLVLIHGWGAGSEIWQDWLPLLCQRCNVHLIDLPGFGRSQSNNWSDKESLLCEIADSLPEKAVVIGFSLGGMLAAQIAVRFPERVEALITISSNVSYVERDSWPDAMPQETYQQFYQLVNEKPAIALKRFYGFQVKGASDEKVLLKKIKALCSDATPEEAVLLSALDCLADIDNSEAISKINSPALYIFSDKDVLVPVSASKKIESLGIKDSDEVIVLNGAPHVPFISHDERCWSAIESFLERRGLVPKNTSIDKKKMAESFSKAALSYDSAAELQRKVGEALLERVPKKQSGYVADVGSGTGYFTEKLVFGNPDADVIAVDIAEGMLEYAREKYNGIGHWLCGDAENLPLANDAVNGVFSSLAIQWCENTDGLFDELYRILKPGAQCWLATLGPATLHELREAWSSVDDYIHVNHFSEKQQLTDSWTQAGFELQEFSEQTVVMEYESLKDLTKELKSLGAHNVNAGRPNGLMGKKRLQQLIAGYEVQRNSAGLLPASYQVWWVCLKK
jgi:malonyl-CoA O-methyltransferase